MVVSLLVCDNERCFYYGVETGGELVCPCCDESALPYFYLTGKVEYPLELDVLGFSRIMIDNVEDDRWDVEIEGDMSAVTNEK